MDIAKILKNCPKGIKLYSPIYGEMEFRDITTIGSIHCLTNKGNSHYFFSDGKYESEGECVLFPSKEQRDWDKFLIPFKDGDIIIRTEPNLNCKYRNIAIFKSYNNSSTNKMNVHCQVNGANEFRTEMSIHHQDWRMATAEEGRHLFTKMHESGYDFKNGKLIPLPKFEVGDTITNGTYTFKISHVDELFYYEEVGITCSRLSIQEQDKWKLKKFDIHSLKPYDKVLVKYHKDGCWVPTMVSYIENTVVYTIDKDDSPICVIPYKNNEHLVAKYDNPDSYYITW